MAKRNREGVSTHGWVRERETGTVLQILTSDTKTDCYRGFFPQCSLFYHPSSYICVQCSPLFALFSSSGFKGFCLKYIWYWFVCLFNIYPTTATWSQENLWWMIIIHYKAVMYSFTFFEEDNEQEKTQIITD